MAHIPAQRQPDNPAPQTAEELDALLAQAELDALEEDEDDSGD